MAARRRSHVKRHLPDNLYESNGYYKYRDPRNDKWYSLGTDERAAIRQANEANFAIHNELAKARLIDKLTGEGDRTFAHFIPIYEKLLQKRKLAETTFRWRMQRLRKVEEVLGASVVDRITTIQISEILDGIEAEGKSRMAQVYRSELMDFFREAQAKGWAKSNPVSVTRAAEVEVKRERLTLEAFQQIYIEAQKFEPWVSNSMALALVTGQRREDLAKMQFTDIHDECLFIEQGKTGAKIRIPIKLRLDALNWSVEEIVRQCRQGILGAYMIRNQKDHATAKAGRPLHTSSLSAGFAKARDNTNLKFKGTPPSFHEIRSLAKRLYDQQGVDTKTLLGHKTEQMANLYSDVRGAEWLEVKLAK
jgi:integrase